MKKLKTLFLVVAGTIVLLPAQVWGASSPDTIVYRLRTTILTDSTMFRYEIGSIQLLQSGGYRFLGFQNPAGLDPDDYWTTDSFYIESDADSVQFARFASFDNKDYIPTVDIDTGNPAAVDSIYHLFRNHYDTLNVRPNSSSFGASSSLMYIVELRKNSDHSLLASLDTLKCYLNAAGELRYQNYPSSFNLRKVWLGANQGVEVYLKVHVLYNLPPTSSILAYTYMSSGGNAPANGFFAYNNQEGLPSVATYGAAPAASVGPEFSSKSGITLIVPDPAKTQVLFNVYGFGNTTVRLELINSVGAVVISRLIQISRNGRIILPVGSVPNGTYTLRVSDAQNTAARKFQIIH